MPPAPISAGSAASDYDRFRQLRKIALGFPYRLSITQPVIVHMPDLIHNRQDVWASYIVIPQ